MMPTEKKLRPAAKVLQYLMDEIGLYKIQSGTRLPTSRELAEQLQVSQGTVKNVYRKLAQEGKLDMRTGDGTFWQGPPAQRSRSYVIGLNMSANRPQIPDTRWTYRINGGLMEEKRSQPHEIQFRFCGELSFSPKGELRGQELLEGIDGLLPFVLSSPGFHSFHSGGREIPAIWFNPQEEYDCRNFVAPDYFAISRKLGKVWRKVGKKRILLLLNPGAEHSISIRLRYGGLLCGLDSGLPGGPEVRRIEIEEGGEAEHGYRAMKQFLQEGKGWTPDALYAAGDHLAFGAMTALTEAGLNIPEEVSIVGGHGADCLNRPPHILSCTEHPLELLGSVMLRLLIRRIDRQGEDVPAHVEACKFIIGTTTSPAENLLLNEENTKG